MISFGSAVPKKGATGHFDVSRILETGSSARNEDEHGSSGGREGAASFILFFFSSWLVAFASMLASLDSRVRMHHYGALLMHNN